jgi:hypothetical protein
MKSRSLVASQDRGPMLRTTIYYAVITDANGESSIGIANDKRGSVQAFVRFYNAFSDGQETARMASCQVRLPAKGGGK